MFNKIFKIARRSSLANVNAAQRAKDFAASSKIIIGSSTFSRSTCNSRIRRGGIVHDVRNGISRAVSLRKNADSRHRPRSVSAGKSGLRRATFTVRSAEPRCTRLSPPGSGECFAAYPGRHGVRTRRRAASLSACDSGSVGGTGRRVAGSSLVSPTFLPISRLVFWRVPARSTRVYRVCRARARATTAAFSRETDVVRETPLGANARVPFSSESSAHPSSPSANERFLCGDPRARRSRTPTERHPVRIIYTLFFFFFLSTLLYPHPLFVCTAYTRVPYRVV